MWLFVIRDSNETSYVTVTSVSSEEHNSSVMCWPCVVQDSAGSLSAVGLQVKAIGLFQEHHRSLFYYVHLHR